MELFTQDLFRYIRDRGSIGLREASEVLGTAVSTDVSLFIRDRLRLVRSVAVGPFLRPL